MISLARGAFAAKRLAAWQGDWPSPRRDDSVSSRRFQQGWRRETQGMRSVTGFGLILGAASILWFLATPGQCFAGCGPGGCPIPTYGTPTSCHGSSCGSPFGCPAPSCGSPTLYPGSSGCPDCASSPGLGFAPAASLAPRPVAQATPAPRQPLNPRPTMLPAPQATPVAQAVKSQRIVVPAPEALGIRLTPTIALPSAEEIGIRLE